MIRLRSAYIGLLILLGIAIIALIVLVSPYGEFARTLPREIARGVKYTLRNHFVEFMRRRAGAEVIASYVRNTRDRKLQIGAGTANLPGWLNTDIEPREGQAYLDAAARFPLPDNSFRYVFAEQLIEHLDYDHGTSMLRESFRVLQPGGKIRLATPNLRKLTALLEHPTDDAARFMRELMASEPQWPRTPSNGAVIINYMLRSWGHQFVYDPDTLRHSLGRAGFSDVREYAMGESDDLELRNIERHDTISPAFPVRYSTMVFEGTKPAGSLSQY